MVYFLFDNYYIKIYDKELDNPSYRIVVDFIIKSEIEFDFVGMKYTMDRWTTDSHCCNVNRMDDRVTFEVPIEPKREKDQELEFVLYYLKNAEVNWVNNDSENFIVKFKDLDIDLDIE